MRDDRIEGKWIDAFAETFALCKVLPDETVAVLSESQSRQINVRLAELALQRLGARPFHVIVPTPKQRAPVPVRSTGATDAVQGLKPVVAALAASGMVVDLTVEGMLHAPELPAVIKDGARLLMISNELRDFESDTALGIRTLTVRIGFAAAVRLYWILIAAAYFLSALLYLDGALPQVYWLLLPLPLLIYVVRLLRASDRRALTPWTGRFLLLFGIGYMLALP